MRREKRIAAGLGVLGLALAGCGEAAATIQISDGPGGGEELFDAMSEAQDEAGSYRLDMTIEAGPETIAADGAASLDGDSIEMRLAMSLPEAGEMEMLLVDDIMYIDASALGLPGDAQWLSIDPNSDDPMAQQLGGAMSFENSVNLQSYFNEYSDEITVEEGGEDTVDGVDVTEYLVTINLSEVDELPNMPQGTSVGDLPFDEVNYSLWVDDDALLRRITSDLGGSGSIEARFFDYGEPVEIEAPDPAEVSDFSDVLGDGAAGG